MLDAATILHADLDAFYAAVEVRDDPTLRGRPVAVGGGVVLAATYEARRFGVGSAMPGADARRRCPALVVVPARFEAYVEASRAVMDILESFTPEVEAISIDEAFLDVAGSVRLFGPPPTIAADLRRRVRAEVGLPISVGVASTKHLAKIASRVAKPDGLVVVEPGSEEAFLRPLPVGHLWGVGPVGEQRLADRGVRTIGDLADAGADTLSAWMGPHWGRHLSALARNRDPRPVEPHRRARSVGAQSAGDATDPDRRHRTLLGLAERIGIRLRRQGIAGRRITVRVRFGDMTAVTRATTLPGPVAETHALYRVAAVLADALVAEDDRRVSLVGISVGALERVPVIQLELPLDGLGDDPVGRAGSPENVRHHDLDTAVDRARSRFGRDAIRRAALLGHEPEERSPVDRLDDA
ncbi:MAG: DNA polymerase IV [Acidimicrobiia bacterium]|nr:DNA polymerase IV [Acidimicrobiia bacterium]